MGRNWLSALAVAFLVTGVAWGATITVDTTDPRVADDGQCSLIEAITNANDDAATHGDCAAGNGADVVDLAPGATYVFDQPYTAWAGPNALPLVESEIRIEGHGSTIRRAVGAPATFRLIAVSFFATLDLVDLTLINGNPGPGFLGGAVLSSGTTRLIRATVTGNRSQCGGGVYNRSGTMVLTDSLVTANVGNHGGGICSSASYFDSLLVLERTTVTDNVSNGEGGGIQCVRDDHRKATLRILDSTISGNTAYSVGGGITAKAGGTISQTTVSDNHAGLSGGGVWALNDDLTIDGCTISGNTTETTLDVGGAGAGLLVYNGFVEVINSTISGNHAYGAATSADYSGRGGGIQVLGWTLGASATVTDSTICDNTADHAGGGLSVQQMDGTAPVELILRNTVVAANLDQGASVLGNCSIEAPAIITSRDFNLTDDSTCNLIAPEDWEVADVMLSPLDSYGGPTHSHRPMAGSPAVDSGDDANCPATDQRGAPRPLDGDGDGAARCDRGSVEFGVLFMDGFESGDTTAWSAALP